MLVSVIIPNYNHEKFLDTRIQSVLNQTYRDFEIIILDDCSTDNSKGVIEKYQSNEHISHIVFNETNSGSTFKQWEKGFELAKGDLIWIAESDDMCDKSFLASLVPMFDNNKVVLAFSRSMQVDQEDHEMGIYPFQQKMDASFCVSSGEFIRNYLSRCNIVVNASSAVFRKDVINKINKDYYSFRGCGDWLFWIYLAEKGCVGYVSKPLNYFRQHLTNTTSKLYKSGNNSKEVHKIYLYLSQHGYLKGLSKTRFRTLRLASYLSSNQFDSNEAQKEVLREWNFSYMDYIVARLLRYYRRLRLIAKNGKQ